MPGPILGSDRKHAGRRPPYMGGLGQTQTTPQPPALIQPYYPLSYRDSKPTERGNFELEIYRLAEAFGRVHEDLEGIRTMSDTKWIHYWLNFIEWDAIVPYTHLTPGDALAAGAQRIFVKEGNYLDGDVIIQDKWVEIRGESRDNTIWSFNSLSFVDSGPDTNSDSLFQNIQLSIGPSRMEVIGADRIIFRDMAFDHQNETRALYINGSFAFFDDVIHYNPPVPPVGAFDHDNPGCYIYIDNASELYFNRIKLPDGIDPGPAVGDRIGCYIHSDSNAPASTIQINDIFIDQGAYGALSNAWSCIYHHGNIGPNRCHINDCRIENGLLNYAIWGWWDSGVGGNINLQNIILTKFNSVDYDMTAGYYFYNATYDVMGDAAGFWIWDCKGMDSPMVFAASADSVLSMCCIDIRNITSNGGSLGNVTLSWGASEPTSSLARVHIENFFGYAFTQLSFFIAVPTLSEIVIEDQDFIADGDPAQSIIRGLTSLTYLTIRNARIYKNQSVSASSILRIQSNDGRHIHLEGIQLEDVSSVTPKNGAIEFDAYTAGTVEFLTITGGTFNAATYVAGDSPVINDDSGGGTVIGFIDGNQYRLGVGGALNAAAFNLGNNDSI